jgi:hypothetical protein
VRADGLASDSRANTGAETRVELEFLEGQRNHRLIFGRPEAVFHRDHHFGITKRVAIFRPGARFGLELWDGKVVLNRSRKPVARTHRWRILVLEAGHADAHMCRVPNVEPGAHVLMEATRTKTCQLLKAWLAELGGQGDPAELPREFFFARDLRLQALWRRNGLRRSGSYVDASSR